jgi:hypothetical protein
MARDSLKKMNYQILREKLSKGEEDKNEGAGAMFENYPKDEPPIARPVQFITQTQGYIVIGLLALGVIGIAWMVIKSVRQPKYAYKAVSVQAQFTKTGAKDSDLNTTSVGIKDEDLAILGNEGWELVGTFLEMETTHPNYGNSEYVTGLQPNIRPQKAVMIFKKQL